MVAGGSQNAKNQRANPFERIDVRGELEKLDTMIETLRIQYEQYFAGILPLAPDPLHNDVKRLIRRLLKAPFKNSEASFRLKSIEGRYHTLFTYWQRVGREREAGTYAKDVFKANMRERFSVEDQRAQTNEGLAERGIQNLFRVYKEALQKHSGQAPNLDYNKFQKKLVERAKELKKLNHGAKVAFKIVVKNGKVTIQAHAKTPTPG
jgi:hypothetical protein